MNIYPASLIKNWILDQSKYRIFAWALTLSVIHCTCGFLSRIICFFQKEKRMKNQNQNQPSVFAKQPLRYRVTYHLTHWGLGERVGNLDNQIRSVQDTPLQSHWLIFIHSELKCWHTNLEWQVGSLQSQSPAGECPCQAHRAIRQMRSWNKKKDQSLILSGEAEPSLACPLWKTDSMGEDRTAVPLKLSQSKDQKVISSNTNLSSFAVLQGRISL